MGAGSLLRLPVQKRASPHRPNLTCPYFLDIASDIMAAEVLKNTGYVQCLGAPTSEERHCLTPGTFCWPMDGQGASENITLGSAERIPELGAGWEVNTWAWQKGGWHCLPKGEVLESFCSFFRGQVAPSSRGQRLGRAFSHGVGAYSVLPLVEINTDCSSQFL